MSSFTVQVITLDKDTVLAKTSNPDVSFTPQPQLDTFTDVQPEISSTPLTAIKSIYIVAELITRKENKS
jgi:hypothetical protein